MKLLLPLVALCLISACAGKPVVPSAASPATTVGDSEIGPIIDAHMHTDFDGKPEQTSGIKVDEATLLKQMKEAGIVGGIVHTQRDGSGYVDLSKHQIWDCAGVDKKVDVARVEAGLKSGKYRCIKVYLGYVYQFAYDPGYKPAYDLARKYKVPVVFHTGDTYGHKGKVKFSDPMGIDEIAVEYPDVNFVIAHLGNPWINTAAEIAYNKPNVYVDLSALMIGDLSKEDPATVETYVTGPIRWAYGYIEDPKKMMFGTDWPLTLQKPYIDAVKRAIPKEHWHAVFYENAKRVFKLPIP